MGLTVDLQRLRAHRQRGLACSNAMMGEVLEGHPKPFTFAGLPSVWADTPPVRIYGADGRLKEVVPAAEFRRRTLEAERGRRHASVK